MQRAVDHICNWLHEYASGAGAQGFVVGISGGIDSALTSTLCTLTGMDTTVVNLPIYQHRPEVDRAQEHIAQLCGNYPNVTALEIELTNLFEQFQADCGHLELSELALANTRARFRMATLYAIAQSRGQLVAGTGNRVEDFGVGFFTKYGDGGVDLSPIAGLMKSQVYALAEHLGISQSIQQATPTDGLWGDGRSDEDQMQASYPELEWAMTFDGDASALDARQADVLAIYRSFNRANHHKMAPPPVCEIPESLLGAE